MVALPLPLSLPPPMFLDLAFAALFAVAYPAWEYLVAWPRTRTALATGAAGARLRVYRKVTIIQWTWALLIVALWVAQHRPWTDLGLAMPHGWRLVMSLLLVAVTGVLIGLQARSIRALSTEARRAVGERFARIAVILPHTRAEHRGFRVLAVTAGICEELLYRGFLVWALQPWLTLWGAAGVSAALFGLGHAYQGRADGIRATITGATLGAIALITSSIIPGMVIHTLVDLGGGAAGYALLADEA